MTDESGIHMHLSESQMDELEGALGQDGELDLSKLSSGLMFLISGYIAYAKEVIINRALPEIDGLKPVHRKILYTMYTEKIKNKMKCARIAGNVLKYHPHGDQSVYMALVRMTDENGTLSIPLIEGQGSFGKVYNTDKPADSRYTEACLHDNALKFFFNEMQGVDYVPNFDGELMEPTLLPVSFPILLCNSTQGIAVGFSCSIPSFNFIDVLDLTAEFIRDGKCSTVIEPDFVTGGYYVKNNKELMKIMQTGKGKLKLRGRFTVQDKTISITEFPFGATIQGIKKQIDDKEIQWVKEASDLDDIDGANLSIECTAKTRVDEVIYNLYKETDLQTTFPVDMTIIRNGSPVRLGVWGIVEEWVKVRRQQLTKEYTALYKGLKSSTVRSQAVLDLLTKPEIRDKFVELLLHHSNAEAIDFLLNCGEFEFDYEICKWLAKRSVPTLRDGGKYKSEHTSVLREIEKYEGYLADIDSVILSQLAKIKEEHKKDYPRRTEITTVDYTFSEANQEEVIKDTTECAYILKDCFLRKIRYFGIEEFASNEKVIYASASDTLIGIDNEGRVIRVYCEHLPYTGGKELGIYLPRYLGVPYDDSYKIMHLWKLDGEDKMLTYTDGTVGFLDTSEWVGTQRQVKVVERGVSVHSGLVGYVSDTPDCLVVLDSNGKIAWQSVDNIKRKKRVARTRVFNLDNDSTLTHVCYLSHMDLLGFFRDPYDYVGNKPIFIESEDDFTGDESAFIPM